MVKRGKKMNKRVKIGILTFHKSINYGAYLQCYSLSNALIKAFPEADVEVIDYCPQYEIDKYEPSIHNFIFGSQYNKQSFKMVLKNVVKLILMPTLLSKKKKQYRAFVKAQDELSLSSKKWRTDDYEAFFQDIENEYDIIIVGSDAVWENLVFSFPSAYFVTDKVNAHKMSYAACSGRVVYTKLSEFEAEYMKNVFEGFDYIGVRDEATNSLVSSLVPEKTIYHNCDPTIFLDLISDSKFAKEKVKNKLIAAGIDLNKPIIGIMGGDQMGKLVRDLFGNEYQIVAVYYQNRYADVYLADLTPFEWAVVFSFFKLTFTRFFHGTIFSLKNGTPTVSIDDWRTSDFGQASKLKDLLERLNLQNHYFFIDELKTVQGLKRIKEAANEFIDNPDTNEIYAALDKEKMHFNNFKEVLTNMIEKTIESKR